MREWIASRAEESRAERQLISQSEVDAALLAVREAIGNTRNNWMELFVEWALRETGNLKDFNALMTSAIRSHELPDRHQRHLRDQWLFARSRYEMLKASTSPKSR